MQYQPSVKQLEKTRFAVTRSAFRKRRMGGVIDVEKQGKRRNLYERMHILRDSERTDCSRSHRLLLIAQ